MELPLARLIGGVLAIWRIALFLTHDKLFEWFRHDVLRSWVLREDGQPKFFWARVFNCFWCTSLIASVIVWPLLLTDSWIAVLPFALSGGAIWIYHSSGVLRHLRE